MSTVDAELEIAEPSVQGSDLEVTAAREARAGDMTVRRLLPLRLRRSVGPGASSTTTGRCRWTGWPARSCAPGS